jgi:hypothetical protein
MFAWLSPSTATQRQPKFPDVTLADLFNLTMPLKLIKIGARVVRHARAITFQLAEVAVTGPTWGMSVLSGSVYTIS